MTVSAKLCRTWHNPMHDRAELASRLAVERALDELILNRRWADFQRIALPLARAICPALVANEITRDGGEDGFLASAVVDRQVLAAACSITASWEKIETDLERIKGRKPELTALWFFTPRPVTAVTSDPWRKRAREEFGVELSVFPREHIVQQLLEPRHQYLLHHHLHLPAAPRVTFATATDIQSNIQAFIDEYLHSETGPVPFGGRDGELADLDTWIRDEQAPPRYLITAPAGRGKSALLVRWIDRLRRDGMLAPEGMTAGTTTLGWHLVFVPISMRFGTHEQRKFYRALAERLAAIASTTLAAPAEDPAGFYVDKARDLLSGLVLSEHRVLRVLLVFDGLDEALRGEFDATLLPRLLPPSVRVVAAARWLSGDHDSTGWLHRLAWDMHVRYRACELPRLDERAIGRVLVQMGAPLEVLAQNHALIARLAELTEGEPLILHYYAMDLWHRGESSARVTLADLERMKPGFGAYFDRWLELQRKAWRDAGEAVSQHNVDAVLMALAFARGPLESSDMLRLTSALTGSTDALVLQPLLEPLRRFVFGDGSPERGYVLSHPKIGEHLQTDRFRGRHDFVERVFVDWGQSVVAEVNRGSSAAARTPGYLLRFYRLHLLAIHAPASSYLTMVQDGWRRAWQSYEGGHHGFAGDVRSALQAVRTQGRVVELGAQLRCVLTLSSMRSLGRYIPESLIVAAMKHDVLTLQQAVHLAELMQNRSSYIGALINLASVFARGSEQRRALLSQAFAMAKTTGDAEIRAHTLLALATCLDGDERNEAQLAALAAARRIESSRSLVGVLYTLASSLDGNHFPQLLALAKTIGDADTRVRALNELASYLSDEQLAESLALTLQIGDEEIRAHELGRLAPYLNDAQLTQAFEAALMICIDRCKAEAVSGLAPYLNDKQLSEALTAVQTIRDQQVRATALGVVAVNAGDLRTSAVSEAFGAAMALTLDHAKVRALCAIAAYLREEQLDVALQAITEIDDVDSRSHALGEFAAYANDRQLSEMLSVARAIESESARAYALVELAAHLDGERHGAALQEALTLAQAIDDEIGRAEAFGHIAAHFQGAQRAQVLDCALAAAKSIGSQVMRARALDWLADQFDRAQLIQALEAAKVIGDEEARADSLIGLIAHLHGEQRRDAVREALGATVNCKHGPELALSKLAIYLSEEQLAQSLTAARSIGDPEAAFEALSDLAPRLTGEQRKRALCEALVAAISIEDMEARGNALAKLANVRGEQCDRALIEARATALSIARRYLTALKPVGSPIRARDPASIKLPAEPEHITGKSLRTHQLKVLIAHMSDQQWQATLTAAQSIVDEFNRGRMLKALAVAMNAEQLTQALAASKAMRGDCARALALSGLAEHLNEEQLSDALAAAQAIDNREDRANALAGLAGHLNTEQLSTALAAAQTIDDANARAYALTELISHLHGAARDTAQRAAFAATHAIDDREMRADALTGLAQYLADDQLERALADLIEIGEHLTRPQLLQAIVAFTPAILKAGGQRALLQLRQAIHDTAVWYP
jgi:hypothetical protein